MESFAFMSHLHPLMMSIEFLFFPWHSAPGVQGNFKAGTALFNKWMGAAVFERIQEPAGPFFPNASGQGAWQSHRLHCKQEPGEVPTAQHVPRTVSKEAFQETNRHRGVAFSSLRGLRVWKSSFPHVSGAEHVCSVDTASMAKAQSQDTENNLVYFYVTQQDQGCASKSQRSTVTGTDMWPWVSHRVK